MPALAMARSRGLTVTKGDFSSAPNRRLPKHSALVDALQVYHLSKVVLDRSSFP